MSFYRSQDMEYYHLIMPRQTAWDTVNLLGKLNLLHIVPNKSLTAARPYINQVKSTDESLVKIKNLQRYISEHKLGYERQYISNQQLNQLTEMWKIHQSTNGVEKSYLIDVQDEVNNIWEYQNKLLNRKNQIKQKMLLYRQNIAIIEAGRKQYGDAFFQIKSNNFQNPDHVSLFGLNQLQVRAAVINDEKSLASVKKTLNRISRGNSFINSVHYKDIFDQIYPDQDNKSVLFVLYPAKKGSNLDLKIVKILQNYCPHWNNYTLPQTVSNFQEKSQNIKRLYKQSQKMYEMTDDQDRQFLRTLLGKVQGKNITQLEYYKFYLMKQRQIYSQLNQMTTHLNFLEAEAYVKKQDQQHVRQILKDVSHQTKTPIATLVQEQHHKFPTYFKLNDFKMPSQQIINTYGVPRYQQANPSFFTVVTFPFLFGVMFGDIAHGLIAFFFGIFLLFQNQNSKNTIIRTLFPYRYLITLMGFFATYCGFIYNDFLSISLNLFGSCFDMNAVNHTNTTNTDSSTIIHKISPDCVYPFGVDPAWGISSNYLNYINSLKMKISVIIAVIHMTLGVFVKASNARFFKNKLQFVFQFIPQIIFMVALFGYMDFLIIFKWLHPWKLYDQNAPSIITTMINLPLKVGKTDKCCGGQPLWGEYGKTSQDFIQFILLILAVICIPLMLIPKPLIQICRNRKTDNNKHNYVSTGVDSPSSLKVQGLDSPNKDMKQTNQIMLNNQQIERERHQKNIGQDKHTDASQIFVHQLIETIEYVLGCISNTASYLRLWALSLAHSQLSQVFFQKTIQTGLMKGKTGIPILILAFPILAGATFGVLLCMDSMQCFLHTLRLHWVEFQNKFYKGDGFLFSPISFITKIKESIGKS